MALSFSLKPRTLTRLARPSRRCAVKPGKRAIDSAIDESGNLPISSAEIDSTTCVEKRLVFIDSTKLPRKPLTSMTSTSSFFIVFSCAAAVAKLDKPAAVNANVNILGLNIDMMFFPLPIV